MALFDRVVIVIRVLGMSSILICLNAQFLCAQLWWERKEKKTVEAEEPQVKSQTAPQVADAKARGGVTKMEEEMKEDLEVDPEAFIGLRKNLDVLSKSYDDLRTVHNEQLVSLRTLASQAKIHGQVIDEINAKMPAGPSVSSPVAGLDALSLEKYRLIRDRAARQKAVLDQIAAQQKVVGRLIESARTEDIPRVVLPPKVNVQTPKAPPAVTTLKQVKNINRVRTAVADAKEQQRRFKEEKEKGAEDSSKIDDDGQ